MNTNLLKATRSPFQRQLAANITQAIQAAKAEGMTAASLSTLRAITKTPSAQLAGAPNGTNAQYQYAELFKDLAEAIPAARRFILPN
jgi:hypothetical protein